MIADISLKQGDGIELVRDVRAHYPQLPILVLSMHDETIYAERMLAAGANGYIMKQAASEQFLIALRRVLDGGIYVSEAVGNNMIQKFAAGGSYISANPIDRLSNRELQILHMIGKGMSTRETAHSLNLSIKTVESHRQRIKRKLNLSTGTQLVQYASTGSAAASSAGEPGCARGARDARIRSARVSRRQAHRVVGPRIGAHDPARELLAPASAARDNSLAQSRSRI
jgi:DNA-binding NarL/FixJ family response regulator